MNLSFLPLKTILTAYGISNLKDQADFLSLLDLAGCLEPKILLEDLKSVGLTEEQIKKILSNRISAQVNIEMFSLSSTEGSDLGYLEKIFNWLVRVTQREFFAREKGVERWQQPTGAWMNKYEKEIKEIVTRLKLCDAVYPKCKETDIVAIFGSTTSNMEARLKFAKKLIDEGQLAAKELLLLAGERPVDKAVDGPSDKKMTSEAYFKALADKNNIEVGAVTEYHLIKDLHKKLLTSEPTAAFSAIPCHVVNAAKGNKPRPNTIDTLNMAKLLPGCASNKRMVFISSAPNISSQYEDVLTVFGIGASARLEISGNAGSENTPLKSIMGALGGRLYGGYVNKALSLGIQKTASQLSNNLQTLSFDAQKAEAKKLIEAADAKKLAEIQAKALAAQTAANSNSSGQGVVAPMLLSDTAVAALGGAAVPASTVAMAQPPAKIDVK